jgi:hypothetical protein
MAAGVLLIAGLVFVARELLFDPPAAPPAAGGQVEREKPAIDAGGGEDPIAADARRMLAAASRNAPRRTKVDPPEAADPDRLDANRSGPRKPPRPGSERWFLESCRKLAAADPAAFEQSARECLAKEASLAEKVAWLLAAREVGRERYDALVDRALEEGRRADSRLRAATVELLDRDARRSPPACLRLLQAVALAPDSAADPAERARAASDSFAFADEATLAACIDLVTTSPDPLLRANVLRGLSRNHLPAAAAHRAHLVESPLWKAQADQLAATDTTGPDDANE